MKVNPPGQDDPYEFVEIKGPPNALLTNVYFAVIEGDAGNNPGTATAVINLTSTRIGSSGLLVILANGSPYFIPSGTTPFYDAHLNTPGGALGNGRMHGVPQMLECYLQLSRRAGERQRAKATIGIACHSSPHFGGAVVYSAEVF